MTCSRISIVLLSLLAACSSSSSVARQPNGTDRSATLPTLAARVVGSSSNPILADGSDYTSDPAPVIAGGKLYILTGGNTAGPTVNDFRMPEWQMLEASGDPMAGRWTHIPHLARPEAVFKWAAPGRAYAAQIMRGARRTRSRCCRRIPRIPHSPCWSLSASKT
jgi:hypothetical protein